MKFSIASGGSQFFITHKRFRHTGIALYSINPSLKSRPGTGYSFIYKFISIDFLTPRQCEPLAFLNYLKPKVFSILKLRLKRHANEIIS